jgi:gluconate 5-dehydrogenase
MSVLDRFRLDGKRLFITGGSRGLGRAMAIGIAEAGADVILVGRTAESLESTAAEIRAVGRQAHVVAADVGEPLECEAACKTALEKHGPIDILINNVGGRRINVPTEDFPLADWQKIIDLNLTSTFLCTKIIGKSMIDRNQGGRIINVASISGMVANRGGIGGRSYETSKAAVIQFTRATAADWAPHKITVNAICPGGFMTDPNIRWSKEIRTSSLPSNRRFPPVISDNRKTSARSPLLASDASRYMTGAALVIDGGYTLW